LTNGKNRPEFRVAGGGTPASVFFNEIKYRASIGEAVAEIQESVAEGDRKTQLLTARIGSEPKSSSEDDGGSVWEAITALQEALTMGKTKVEVVRKSQATVGEKYLKLKQEVDDTDLSLVNLSDSYRDMIGRWKNQLHNLTERLEVLEVGADVPRSGGGQNTYSHSDLDNLRHVMQQEIDGLTLRLDTVGTRGTRGPAVGGTNVRLQEDLLELSTRMDSFVCGSNDARWELEIWVLRAAMDHIEDRVSDTGFELDNFSFLSKAELRKFVIDEEVPSAGQCWDLFSVLVVMKPKNLTGKELAANRFSAECVSTTTLENDLALSMLHDQPGLLFGLEGGLTAAADKGLAMRPSYLKWIGKGRESYKQKLGKLLKNYSAGVRGSLAPGEHVGPDATQRAPGPLECAGGVHGHVRSRIGGGVQVHTFEGVSSRWEVCPGYL
jgi:hypothetical protein